VVDLEHRPRLCIGIPTAFSLYLVAAASHLAPTDREVCLTHGPTLQKSCPMSELRTEPEKSGTSAHRPPADQGRARWGDCKRDRDSMGFGIPLTGETRDRAVNQSTTVNKRSL